MKKAIIFFLFFVLAVKAQNDSLSLSLNNLLSQPFFDTTIISMCAYNLNNHIDIYKKNSSLLLRPASNMKILTTISGLLFLGTDYKFSTELYYSGKIVGGVLKGDLYIKGGMNPDFSLKDIDSLVSFIKQAGISMISGNIYGDISIKDTAFWGEGWMWDDDPSTDSPYLSALNINDNAVTVIVTPTKYNQKPFVKTIPDSKFFTIQNEALSTSSKFQSLKISRDWINRNNNITITGNININSKPVSRRINIYSPENYFVTLFKEKLKDNNIKYSDNCIYFKNVPIDAQLLNKLEIRFDSVIVNLNKTSDNLSAEMTLRSLSAKFLGTKASAEKGIKLVDSLITLAGRNPKNYVIVDGSGLSHYNLVSSDLLLSVLKYLYITKPELFSVLYNSFPIGGVDGTLKNRMKDSLILNNVHAKTGTISGVSSLSGFLKTIKGEDIVFSILIQNYAGSSTKARYYQDEICKLLAKYGSN